MSRKKKLLIACTATLLCALTTFVAVDRVTGLHGQDHTVRLSVIEGRVDAPKRAIVVLPGIIGSGYWSTQSLRPWLTPLGTVIGVNYPVSAKPNMAAIYNVVMAEIERRNLDHIVIYGQSMGGMVAADWLRLYKQRGLPMGPIEALILDSAPSQRADVKFPAWQGHLVCGMRYQAGDPSTAIFRWVQRRQFGNLPPLDGRAKPEIVQGGYDFAMNARAEAYVGQACYVYHFKPPAPREFGTAVQRVYYLRGHDFNGDPVIRLGQAEATWEKAFNPSTFWTIKIDDWQPGWHSPLMERPTALGQAIQRAVNAA